jgi:hypothetical protein
MRISRRGRPLSVNGASYCRTYCSSAGRPANTCLVSIASLRTSASIRLSTTHRCYALVDYLPSPDRTVPSRIYSNSLQLHLSLIICIKDSTKRMCLMKHFIRISSQYVSLGCRIGSASPIFQMAGDTSGRLALAAKRPRPDDQNGKHP